MSFLGKLALQALIGATTNILTKLATEEMAQWAILKIAEAIVKSTKTTKDDEWLKKIESVVNEKENDA